MNFDHLDLNHENLTEEFLADARTYAPNISEKEIKGLAVASFKHTDEDSDLIPNYNLEDILEDIGIRNVTQDQLDALTVQLDTSSIGFFGIMDLLRLYNEGGFDHFFKKY